MPSITIAHHAKGIPDFIHPEVQGDPTGLFLSFVSIKKKAILSQFTLCFDMVNWPMGLTLHLLWRSIGIRNFSQNTQQ